MTDLAAISRKTMNLWENVQTGLNELESRGFDLSDIGDSVIKGNAYGVLESLKGLHDNTVNKIRLNCRQIIELDRNYKKEAFKNF